MAQTISSGFLIFSDAQAKLTLSRMRQKVRQAVQDHEFVWWAREQINRLAPFAIQSRDESGIARAVRQFVGDHIRFCRDPVGVENLTPPEEHMQLLKTHSILLGDCDDAATLSAALGMALGIPATFTIKAFWKPDNPYQHVVTYLHPKSGGVIDIDTTRDAKKVPPKSTREFSVRV